MAKFFFWKIFDFSQKLHQTKLCPHETCELKLVLTIVFTIRKTEDYEYSIDRCLSTLVLLAAEIYAFA